MFEKQGEITIGIINGPNINLIGKREPQFYGTEKWVTVEEKLKSLAKEVGVNLLFFQSNHEGEIVDFIQKYIDIFDGIVINPAAYTKTGYAILDSLTSINIPYVEVHLSNIFSRGGWHSDSIFAQSAIGHIIGFKWYVYDLGLRALINHISSTSST